MSLCASSTTLSVFCLLGVHPNMMWCEKWIQIHLVFFTLGEAMAEYQTWRCTGGRRVGSNDIRKNNFLSYFIIQCSLNVLVAWCCSKHDEVWLQIKLILFAFGGTNVECQPLKYKLGGRGGFSITWWRNFHPNSIREHDLNKMFQSFNHLEGTVAEDGLYWRRTWVL